MLKEVNFYINFNYFKKLISIIDNEDTSYNMIIKI